MAYKRPEEDDAKPNLTPMIDMTFLLVVFFMITIDLTQKEYVQLNLPFARKGVEDKEERYKEIPRMIVNLLPNGDIMFKGIRFPLATGSPAEQLSSLVALRDELQTLTANPEWREPDRSSMVSCMIHGDRSARWQYVQWIMQICAEETIAIYQIQFAVKSPDPDEEESP